MTRTYDMTLTSEQVLVVAVALKYIVIHLADHDGTEDERARWEEEAIEGLAIAGLLAIEIKDWCIAWTALLAEGINS